MRFLLILLVAISFGVHSQTSVAEIFLGEEPKTGDGEQREAPKVKSNKTSRPSESAVNDSTDGTWGGSFGLGAGAGFFAAHGAIHYGWNRFVGVTTSYDYERVDTAERYGEEHGPDVMLVFRLPNPTVVTPVVGAGPGYLYWTRKHNNVVFDESQSPVMNYFAGINIALSRNFGVSIHRRKLEYLKTRPLRYTDRERKEDWARVDNSIGFYAAF